MKKIFFIVCLLIANMGFAKGSLRSQCVVLASGPYPADAETMRACQSITSQPEIECLKATKPMSTAGYLFVKDIQACVGYKSLYSSDCISTVKEQNTAASASVEQILACKKIDTPNEFECVSEISRQLASHANLTPSADSIRECDSDTSPLPVEREVLRGKIISYGGESDLYYIEHAALGKVFLDHQNAKAYDLIRNLVNTQVELSGTWDESQDKELHFIVIDVL